MIEDQQFKVREEIENVEVRTEGRIERKYMKLDGEVGLYLVR